MKTLKPYLSVLVALAIGVLTGCSASPTKAISITDGLRASLDQAGLKDVTATQDREKGVITLGGHVAADSNKDQAESIARSAAGIQVVANQIAVIPPGDEHAAKKMNSDLDDGIGSNLDAALIQSRLHKNVKYQVRSQVVTLTGNVDSQNARARAGDVASSVPNVEQVVNELQIKNQKASSSN